VFFDGETLGAAPVNNVRERDPIPYEIDFTDVLAPAPFVKTPELKPLASEAKQIATEIEARGARLTVKWIPREQNRRADALIQGSGTRHAA
jgi:hypothetical protein